MSSDALHQAVETRMERFGGILRWVPFILIIALACTNTTAATWSAFGVQTGLVLLSYYRSTYNERVQPFKLVEIGLAVGYLVMGIVNQALPLGFPCHLISPVSVSLVFVLVVCSLVISRPFTIQYAMERMDVKDEAIFSSPEFLKLNMLLTAIWSGLLLIMTISVWCAYGFFRDNTQSAGFIVLGIVIPIVIPVLAAYVTPLIGAAIRKNRESGADVKKSATMGKGDDQQFDGDRHFKPIHEDLATETLLPA